MRERTHGLRLAARSVAACGLLLGIVLGGCGGPRLSVPSSDPRFEFDYGRAEFQRQHYVDAQQHLRRFLDLNPGHAQADSAQFLIGLSLFHQKSYAEAAVEFTVLPRDYPRSDLVDDAAYYECLSYFEQMRPAQFDPTAALRARTCLSEFLLRYPQTTYRGEAEKRLAEITDRLAEKEYRLGVLFARLKRPEAALIYLQGLVHDYPTSSWVPQALLWIGRSQEMRPDDAAAIESYRRLIEQHPQSPAAQEAQQELRRLLQRHPDKQAAASDSAQARP